MPDAQLRARETTVAHAELDAEAARLGERIGTAPSRWLRSLTIFEGGCALYLLLPIMVISGFFVARAGLEAIEPLLGRRLADDDRYLTMGSFGVTTAIVGLGLLGATYASRRLAGLRELQAGLAAKRPERPGGPSSCRLCGADLDFAPRATAARCRYCSAENLVAVDPSWLRHSTRAKDLRELGLREAWLAHRLEAERLRRSFRSRAIAVGVVGAGFMSLTGTLIFSAPAGVPETPYDRWAKEAATPRLIIDRAFVRGESDVELSPLLSVSPCDRPGRGIVETFRFAPQVCHPGARCVAPWYVALRAGDVVRFQTKGEPRGFVLFFPQSDEPPFDKSGRGDAIGKGQVAAGKALELEAPRDGWYLVLYSIDAASPDEKYDLCAQLIRP